ncbi:DUF3617 domain-containing protein [Sphingomonas psychrotolerans]|uniref:DUF3617 domain-containing protein n=1 Tax=Sphingomonas psychrotolerans TaxID=1327635 RepID=A0ABU3N2D3_9SPHN|nr:DUF3617 domain-containing protein [Sphingomonas psychrotolerans]MDT8758558.1 DUF3617 domain-containing protein [Sphingomonas psychrotolerans]
MNKLLLLAPLALSACNSGPSVEATNASTKEVADKVAKSGVAIKMAPGHWEGSATITDMQIPGLPPEAAAQMKASMAQAHKFDNCLTPEEAEKPSADFFSGQNKDCRYDHFSMDGGKLDAKMVCKTGGMTVNATMTGTFSRDNFQLAMTSKSEGMPGQPMTAQTMSMKMEARRTGECTGKESS